MAKDKPSPAVLSNTERAAALILSGKSKKRGLARLLPFMGPAFIASVAYMDPGNFATNIQGGAQFGYTLLWVVGATNLMAILIQTLSAKLGIASGKNLAELCRENFPRPVVIGMWVLMEIVAMATDLAEFIGAALGFYLLLGIPLWIAGFLTAIITFAILGLERYGFRPLEAVITAMIGVISISYLIEIILVHPDWRQVAYHTFIPQFSGSESVLLAVGILGATIMPHVIFLHSSLTQKRIVVRSPAKLRRLFNFELTDVVIAMVVAGSINAAMLMTAASTFYHQGVTSVATLQDAYKTLQPLLGKASGIFFGLALLASGLSSSSVGTMAGQVIMQGFLHKEIPVWIRRVATMVPSLLVILIGLDPTRTLVISQVVLSFGLPFAVVPLIIFTSRRKVMKVLVNKKITTLAASLVLSLIVSLDIYLLVQTILRK
jgi:manganese transport protein